MVRRITPQTSLDNLKKEAKRWLKALREGAPDARARFTRALGSGPPNPALRDVQHALAHEFGFDGWISLTGAITRRIHPHHETDPQLVARFLDYACPDHHVRGRPAHRIARHAAMRLLEQHPDIATANLATAVVCGEIEEVGRILEERPELANAKSDAAPPERSGVGGSDDIFRDIGPKGWEPLLYLSFTRLPLQRANDNSVEIAGMLLDHGADPNAFFMAGASRYTPFTGVAGEGEEDRPPHPRRDALARLLLERGANPYDIQVVYDLGFHGKCLWFLKLIYEISLKNGRKADWDDPEWHMLDMGDYGTGARWHLREAISHDDLELAEWCLSHGADPNAPPERDHRLPQSSLYEHAVRQGRTAIAELLVRYGAEAKPVSFEPEEAFANASMRLDRTEAGRIAAEHPEVLQSPKALLTAAKEDRVEVIELLLDLGVSIEIENKSKRRPLHEAAYANALRAAKLLIARGAEIDPVETQWGNTPLDFAVYAEHPRMIELLSRYSRDVWNLTFVGAEERLRELIAEEPELARVQSKRTPLFWLCEDEATALRIAELFIANGADAGFRNKEDGTTAADIARRRGMNLLAAFLDSGAGGSPALEGPSPSAEEGAQRRSSADYEQLARDLVAVHDDGDADALQRIGEHYGRRMTHEDVRAGVWSRVYAVRQRASRENRRHLELDEAHELIAREAGFGNWSVFIDALTTGRPAPGKAYQVNRKKNSVAPRRMLVAAEWESLLTTIGEQRITAIEAGEQMTDDILARVADLDCVTRLDLEGCRQITDAGLQQLARMPQLAELNLSGTMLTDHALEVLRHLPNLRRFQLCWQRGITDAGIANLAHCEQLESVDLMGSETGDGAIRALAGKPKLTRFKTGRHVTDAGLPILHRFPVFKSWQGGEMKYSLMEAEAGPNHLLLDGPFTNDGVAALAGLEGLFGLGFFWHTPAITPAALGTLVTLPNLGFLIVQGDFCDDTAMSAIGAMPHLRMLLAQGTVATDDGFVALSRSRTLEYLWGRECPNLTGRGFAALSNLPALRGIGVSCKNVDDGALATLPRFPALRELMPMDLQDEGFRHVGRCERLDSLWCMYCRETTDAATEHIRTLKLKTYYAGKTQITDRSLGILARMDSLERLMFWETAGITNEGVRLLARLPNLTELSVEGAPQVTADAFADFADRIAITHSP